MKARDVMVSPVITVRDIATVKEVAGLLLEKRISAVPVLNREGKEVGIVSEGDLIRRAEAGTERRRSFLLALLAGRDSLAADYVKANAGRIADVMTRNVVTVMPETPLHEIAELFERRHIKRVPVVSSNQLVGIVTRANLVQAVASSRPGLIIPGSDAAIRDTILAQLKKQSWSRTSLVNVTVNGGIVDLWGMSESPSERDAIRVLAENTPGVVAVIDNLAIQPVEAVW